MAQVIFAAAGQAVGAAMAAIRQVAPTPNPTPSKGEGVGKSYLGFEIAAIKGFCGVIRVG